MIREKTVGVILFRKNPDIGIQYLALYLRNDYWNFPKGHVEDGESEIETAMREVYEEVGIRNLKFIDGWRQQTQFIYKETHREKPELIRKDLMLYLAEADMKTEIKLLIKEGEGEKINGYAWLDFKTALKYLKFKNLKEILKEADSFINSQK
ncbi:MAG: NUDIX domain-containing protein [Candidatus Buchananbacteria bacterium]|jgi:8-oxo-dGTP pyrophosphatase MutT (NUDIX family)